jgi:predicted ATP-dependent Lon-type protease
MHPRAGRLIADRRSPLLFEALLMEPLSFDVVNQKPTTYFLGRVVRKNLVRQTKTGFNVPVYVLEYLLGKYCSSTDLEVIARGLEYVRDTRSRNYEVLPVDADIVLAAVGIDDIPELHDRIIMTTARYLGVPILA